MRASEPPALATWLMSRLVSGEKSESMIGDLIERHGRGRSSAWYWRQTISAIVTSLVAELWYYKLLALWIAALSTFLSDIYMLIGVPVWVFRLDQLWYPHLINSRWSWMVINPWAYRLQLYSLTPRIAWCALLATVSWVMSRLHPRQRGLVVTLFLAPQVGLCVPYARTALTDWLLEPGNPMWFFNVLWFSLFAFIAIPSSILSGGLGGSITVGNGRRL
jgi:hypothetical protein